MTASQAKGSNPTLRLFLLTALLALLIAACGSPDSSGGPGANPTQDQSPAQPTATTQDSAASQPTQPAPTEAAAPTAAAPTETDSSSASDAIMTISQEQQATWVRNFNPFVNDNRYPTRYGIYEPLLIYNTVKGEITPWLATDYAWNDDNSKLTFTIREGVNWTDGQPLTAKDVAFTFNLFNNHKGLQGTAAGVWEYLESVTAPDERTVEFTFKKVFTPALFDIGHQVIVAEHIWKDVADPIKETNENPVGSGPFTEVAVFQNQIWELHRNPNYWQKDKPYIQGLRFPSYPGNDQANLATINGENDWAANFIPDIENTFVSKNPENFGYWFPATGATVMLYANTTRPPFDDVNVRKAISMCINREQIVKVAMYDYTHPSDATGLSDAYQNWKSQEVVEAGTWVQYNVEEANRLLDEAGLAQQGAVRAHNGQPLAFDINVVSGWTDWVSAVQIMAQNLKQCGFDAQVKTYDFSAWFERVQTGDFDLSIGWSSGGATPFNYYRGQMSSFSFREVGETAGENWHRFVSEDADKLLDAFAATSDQAEQQQIMNELQMVFVEQAPAIPLFPGPHWYEYNTTRFTGFPTKDNPYAIGSTYQEPERLLVLTTVKPK